MSKETHESIKPVGSRPGSMSGLCKVHKQETRSRQFSPISANSVGLTDSHL